MRSRPIRLGASRDHCVTMQPRRCDRENALKCLNSSRSPGGLRDRPSRRNAAKLRRCAPSALNYRVGSEIPGDTSVFCALDTGGNANRGDAQVTRVAVEKMTVTRGEITATAAAT